MLCVVFSLASVLMTLTPVQQKPAEAQAAALRGRDALIAQLIARADAVLAEERVQLSEEDREVLRARIQWSVDDAFKGTEPPSPERQAILGLQVEKAVRMIVAATLNPSLPAAITTVASQNVTRAVGGLAPRQNSPPAATGASGSSSKSKAEVRCFSSKVFEILVAQTSTVVQTVANSSRVNIALTALLASTLEVRARKDMPKPGETCVDTNRIDELQKELEALLSQPTRSQAPSVSSSPGGSGGAPTTSSASIASRSASAAPVSQRPSTTEGTKGLIPAPTGIVRKVLNAFCPYPFCL